MINYPIRELVNESFCPASANDSTALVRFTSAFFPEDNKNAGSLDFETYFESKRNILKMNLWKTTYYRKLSHMNKRYLKMSITKHISSYPSDIGKDKTFYFLGKRYTKTAELKKVAEHYRWTQETEDITKADFLILGENIKWEDAAFNGDLHLPVVMDESIRVHYHFLFNVEKTSTPVNQEIVSSYLNGGDYDHFKMVVNMIQYLAEDAISDENKFRLIRAYVKTFTGKVFDINNKEHVWISDTVQKYCHPYHRTLVTKSYLIHSKFAGWETSYNKGTYHPSLYSNNDLNFYGDYHYTEHELIHTSPDMNLVCRDDVDSRNSYCETPEIKFKKVTDYATIYSSYLYANNLHQMKVVINGLNSMTAFIQQKGDKLEIICTSIDGSSSEHSSPAHDPFAIIYKDKWEDNYESTILPLLYDILDSCELVNGQLRVKKDDTSYIKSCSRLDEIISTFYIHSNTEIEFLFLDRLKRRKIALSQM